MPDLDREAVLRLLDPYAHTTIGDERGLRVATAEEILMRITSTRTNRDLILRALGGRPSDSGYMRKIVWEFD